MSDTNFLSDEDFDAILQQSGLEQSAPEAAPASAAPEVVPATDVDDDDIWEDIGEVEQAPAAQEDTPAATTVPTPDMAEVLKQQTDLMREAFQAQTQTAQTRIAELEARLSAYEQSKPEEPQKAWYDDIAIEDIPPEQLEAYKSSLPVIQALARKEALEIAKRMQAGFIDPQLQSLQQNLQPLHEQVNLTTQAANEARQRAFQQEVNAALPWLSGAVSTPAYRDYYEQVIPGTGGIKRGQLVRQAASTGNVQAMVELLQGFQPAQKQDSAQYVAPGRGHTATTANATTAPRRKGMTLSKYSAALDKYSSGKMTEAEFQKYQAAWDTALVEGTAVMDS